MSDRLRLHAAALDEFGRRVHAVKDDQWHAPTPCREWDVRDLVNHIVVEQLWVAPLMSGETVASVGDRFDGDQLGDDPVAAWDAASVAAQEALTAPGAIDRTVHLSFGDVPATVYVQQLASDLAIHAWDLARGINADDRLDPDLVAAVRTWTEPQRREMEASGLFDPPVPVGPDADPQTALLALFGRRMDWPGTGA
jgi:uncharacterized protein (TIGR03086 family)